MIYRQFARYIFTKSSSWAAEKSQLATLRKKTGYTFANCKKALELHNNDLKQVIIFVVIYIFICIPIIMFLG